MATPVEQIKDRLSIVDVVSGYVKLDKAGSNFRGRCPFHNEKTPSFFVSPGRQSFHCFGCNKGGDIFTFTQEIEGLDFPEALKILANRASVKLEPRSGQPRDNQQGEKEYLRRVLEVATRYFEKRLSESKEVTAYLKKRGLTEETMTKFRIGFAPDGWRNLTQFCLEQNIRKDRLEKAGLVIPSPKNPAEHYDRFRGRVMFPIMDREGVVIGFSGRVFDPEGLRNQEAKYVNSPQTLLYDKSQALYGYHLAKTAIRSKDRCVLVEGQMDLVMSHQAGLAEAVAVSGTALTQWHLTVIKRIASKLVMAFDADSAGINASRRALQLALALGFEVRIAKLPNGQDPADLALADPQAWSKAVDEAVHAIDFYLEVIKVKFPGDVRAQGKAMREEIYPLVSVLAHKIDQAYFISKISEILGLMEDIIWQDVRAAALLDTKMPDAPSIIKNINLLPEVLPSSRLDKIEERLVGLLWWLEEKKETLENVKNCRDKLGRMEEGDYLINLEQRLSHKKDSLLLEVDILYEGKEVLVEFDHLLTQLEESLLRKKLIDMTRELKQAEVDQNLELVDKYMKKCQDISQQIRDLTNKKHYAN